MKRILLLLLLIPFVASCATTRAQAPADRPPLDVPAAPPRIIEPMPSPPQLAAIEPVAELPEPPPATPPRPKAPRDTSARDTPKPDAKPETPPEPAAPVAPPPAAAAPVPPLSTPGTADGSEAARQVRQVLDRATKALSSVDYRVINKELRAQYDNAKLFMQQAEEAIKQSNFVYAKVLADKADRIAKELQGR
ncbi:MAG: hypothetical protein LC753_06350 [Acidobacteria bacterium]|nr:hypothetical protein [Acidobacteriota bacterium]MCA1649910.1 hypothetical protein [Acidobacteriota bacterium]